MRVVLHNRHSLSSRRCWSTLIHFFNLNILLSLRYGFLVRGSYRLQTVNVFVFGQIPVDLVHFGNLFVLTGNCFRDEFILPRYNVLRDILSFSKGLLNVNVTPALLLVNLTNELVILSNWRFCSGRWMRIKLTPLSCSNTIRFRLFGRPSLSALAFGGSFAGLLAYMATFGVD